MHTGVRPYRCDECGKQFCQLVNYRTHLRSHSQKASIHCQVCSTIFDTEEQLQKHLDTNHFENEFYQCDFCKKIFTDLELCQAHVDKHRQQAKRHLCLKCGTSFRQRNSLLRHLEWHSRGFFSCSDCERTFSSKASLLRHSFSHSGVLPYTCLKCKRHFRLPSLYRNHECNPENIQCMACLVFFKSQEDFDQHKKDTGCWGHQGALPSKTDEIRCMECGQVCASVEELKKHGSTHQRVLKCVECGMGFRSSLMLMSHMGGHAGQRPCLCKDCGLGFPHQQGYDSHLKTCGQVAPPVATAKKPKPNKPPRLPPPSTVKPIAPKVFFQTLAQDSNLVTFSHNKVAHAIPLGDQKQPADGVWKLTLNEKPPPGVPLVMLLPVSSSTSHPTQISPNILPSSLVLETPSSAPCVISMPVVPPNPVIIKERQDIPGDILIPMDSDEVGERTPDLEVTAEVEAENKQISLKDKPEALISDEKVNSSKDASLNSMSSSNLKDCDSSPGMAEGSVPLPVTAETPVTSISLVSSSSEVAFDQGQKSGDCVQGLNACDAQVEVNEEIRVEIGDEDSGVDMLEGELHECVTCGQVLPEKEMIQHCLKHAAVSDIPRVSSVKCASNTIDRSPSCSPSRKRQRSGTEL